MAFTRKAHDTSDLDLYEYRNDLYYKSYKYKLRVKVSGASFFYRLDSWQQVKSNMALLKRNMNRNLYLKVEQDRPNIEAYLEWKLSLPKEEKSLIRIREESGGVSIFGNDLAYLNKVKSQLKSVSPMTISEAKELAVTGVKFFAKEPKFSNRIYMVWRKHTKEEKDKLYEFVKKNGDKVSLSTPMYRWIREKNLYFYSQSSYYMEFNEESLAAQLMLMFDSFGKFYKLEKRPDVPEK